MTTASLDYGIPRLNEKGYRDPTAYKALKDIQQTEFDNRPLTYICSPYSGDAKTNAKIARDLSAYAVQCRRIPLAPHLLFPQFMDDTNPVERETAMWFNRVLLTRCDSMWVYTPRVSKGMRLEIDWAHQLVIPIAYLDRNFEEVLSDD
ncbi:DUF4406 domain-containing protein [Propionimicrobium sp. BV2F7]|uniref:DUF7768 domain-containing protein n=1 Tax=Propionimicrobium sp. BV2F7 TaxID=1111131 RepID=UPI0005645C4E|nr:DUF4406 domain-containing protein [Propionimicrobium sp. BV2F7]